MSTEAIRQSMVAWAISSPSEYLRLRRHMEIAVAALDKEVADLTDEERVAIAIAAGCETETKVEPGGSALVTIKGRVGIAKIDGQFIVGQNTRVEE